MDVKDFEMFELNVTAEEAAGLEPGKEVAYIASLGKKKLE
jgi:translation initiation factor 5A